jgi:tetratricopeptide (TPR) repeat protein
MGNIGVVIVLLCVGLAIAIPFYNNLSTEGSMAVELPSISFSTFWGNLGPSLGIVWQFGLSAITSVWGWVYIVIIFFVGQLGIRKWGGILSLLAILVGVLVLVSFVPEQSGLIIELAGLGPDAWIMALLKYSAETYGSPGFAALFVGIAISILIFPAQRESVMWGNMLVKVGGLGQQQPALGQSMLLLGDSKAMTDLQRAGFKWSRYLLAFIALVGLNFGLLAFLWMALRQYAKTSLPTAFTALLTIPDITVPHWKPVWHVSYFVLGVVYLIVVLVLQRLQARNNQQAQQNLGVTIFSQLVITVLLVLLVPAGVVLAMFGTSVSQMAFSQIVTWITGRRIKEIENRELADQVKEKLQARELGTAENLLKQLKERDSSYPELDELNQSLHILKRQRDLEILDAIARVNKYIREKNVLRAEMELQRLRRLSPSHPEIPSLRQKIRAIEVEGITTREKIAELLRALDETIANWDAEGAQIALDELKDLAPRHSALSEMQEKIERLEQVAQLVIEVQGRIDDNLKEEAQAVLDKLIAIAPDYPEKTRLQDEIIKIEKRIPAEARIIDVLVSEDDTYYALSQDGELFHWKNGKANQIEVALNSPQRLARIDDHRLAVLDREGTVFVISAPDSNLPQIEEFPVEVHGQDFAISQHQAVAVVGRSGKVVALYLSSKQERTLTDDAENACYVEFSNDNTHLAIGTTHGEVYIFNIAKNEIVRYLAPGTHRTGKVIGIAPGIDDSWYVLYEEQLLICWDREGQYVADYQLLDPPTCLTVDTQSERIAIGDIMGTIEVRPLDLNLPPLESKNLHRHPIVKTVFLGGGHVVISIDQNGYIGRLTLR